MADDGSVKVAVRVRPFNDREKGMNAKLVIGMNGTSTTITDPETNQPKTFAFDHSYWSHDGFVTTADGMCEPAPGSSYASQRIVFDDLGQDILRNAFNGYNCSLFAYGQTGAGKSYSMVGYGTNKGIIPIVCEELFNKMRDAPDKSISYQVTTSMLEIYNEQVRDLLNPKVNKAGGLKVRSKPGVGVYVEGLTPVPVGSYAEVEEKMEEGTKNRTVASTKMNATSSRAHTVFTIMFTQIKEVNGEKSEVTSKINLVDLAGSERADSTGATGDRLKEGSAINQSLSALGNVISALAEKAQGKKKVFIPYRNSVLTRLLQDALGGNSKTIMIAALSPADVNFDETLSTLRYADRAKKIKNDVTKNENPTDRMIRELKEENTRLLALLAGKGIDTSAPAGEEEGEEASGGASGGSKEAEEALRRQMEDQMRENARLLEEMQKSWEQKVAEARANSSSTDDTGAMSKHSALATSLPYIINLHEDPQLSECVLYVFKNGETRIGRADAEEKQDIRLTGLNIRKQHAVVRNDGSSITIEPVENSKTFVNGELCAGPTALQNGDRVIIGNNFVFRFHNPAAGDGEEHKTWGEAMEEFTTKQGLRIQQDISGMDTKLEAEEAAKRKELEDKLRQMEESMRREREQAQLALQQQRQLYEGKLQTGQGLSAEEAAKLQSIEQDFQAKASRLEHEIEQKKEISEKILQEQMKRKRENKKIQQDLDALLPVIQEANSMAAELSKPVTFEARLQVKSQTGLALSPLDELKNLKRIDVVVRVTNNQDGSVWNWNHEKFQNRIFMMRELYQDFLSYGPKDIPQAHDPFWDPPEAIEIGKAYVYLKALSQLVEIENSFVVVDYKGEEQGQLTVEVHPEDPSGEEIDYLQSSEELLGKNINFKVKIASAHGLPEKFGNDVFVTYSFMNETHETDAHEQKSANPVWNYERRFAFENIDERVRQYLLTEAIIFEIKGFTDAQSRAAVPQALPAGHGGAHGGVGAGYVPNAVGPVCEQCEERAAAWDCDDCSKTFCADCFDLLHKSARKKDHNKRAVGGAAAAAADAYAGQAQGGASVMCGQCEEQQAILHCQDCDKHFCPGCNDLLHKSKKKADHVRIPLGPAAGSAEFATAPPHNTSGGYACQQCEERPAILKCADCNDGQGKLYCGDCNDLLHKSKKKADHQRLML